MSGKKNIIAMVLSALLLCCQVAEAFSFQTEGADNFINSSPNTSNNQRISQVSTRDMNSSMTAWEWVNGITVGWNLADSFGNGNEENRNYDGSIATTFYETYFGNPIVTEELIDRVHDAGFNAIRIMISWHYNMHSDGMIDSKWLARIAEVVQYALNNDMKVIITACDANMFYSDEKDFEYVKQNIQIIWGQVANYFKEYDYRVAFESFNEVLNQISRNDWNVTSSGVNVFNQMTQVWVDTIRQSGGKNADRILICNTWADNPNGIAVTEFKIPNDIVQNRIVIEVHSYNGIMNELISQQMELLDEYFIQKGCPVIYGEYATAGSGNVSEETMALQVSNFIAVAQNYGIKVFYYDSGVKTSYGLFNRNTFECFYPKVLEALFNPQIIPVKGVDRIGKTTVVSNEGLNTIQPLNDNGVKSDKIIVAKDKKYIIQLEWVKTNIRLRGIRGYNAAGTLIDNIDFSGDTGLRIYEYLPGTGVQFFEIEVWNPWKVYDYSYYTAAFDAGIILCSTELAIGSTSYGNSKVLSASEFENGASSLLCIRDILNNKVCGISASQGQIQIVSYDANMKEIQKSVWNKTQDWVCASEVYYVKILWRNHQLTSTVSLKYQGNMIIDSPKQMFEEDSPDYELSALNWKMGKINGVTGIAESVDNAVYYNAYIPVKLYYEYVIDLPDIFKDYKWFVIALDKQYQVVEDYGGYTEQTVLYITDSNVEYIEIYLQKQNAEIIDYADYVKSLSHQKSSIMIKSDECIFRQNIHFMLSDLMLGIRPNDSSSYIDFKKNSTFIKSGSSATTELLNVEGINREIGLYVKYGSLYLYEYNAGGKLINKTLCRKSMIVKLTDNTKKIRLMGTYASHKDDTINMWYSGKVISY